MIFDCDVFLWLLFNCRPHTMYNKRPHQKVYLLNRISSDDDVTTETMTVVCTIRRSSFLVGPHDNGGMKKFFSTTQWALTTQIECVQPCKSMRLLWKTKAQKKILKNHTKTVWKPLRRERRFFLPRVESFTETTKIQKLFYCCWIVGVPWNEKRKKCVVRYALRARNKCYQTDPRRSAKDTSRIQFYTLLNGPTGIAINTNYTRTR